MSAKLAQRALPRTVIVLGLVSLLNDAASEMITPILPLFLTITLGAGPAVVGLIEGLAAAVASLLQLGSGRLVDRGFAHKRLVLSGYTLSNVVRPAIGLAFSWTWVLALRFLDRIGKGLRTTPRDALIAAAVDERSRGRAFGFHRAMDHTGAVLGPIVAFVLLQGGIELRNLFLISAVPGTLLLWLLWRGLPSNTAVPGRPPTLRLRGAWRAMDKRVRRLVIAASGLSFAAIPDVFLVLWATGLGLSVVWVPLLWAVAHAGRALVALIGGSASDRVGRIPVVVIGWSGRCAVLIAMALDAPSGALIWILFLGYAMASGLTEGAERALIGDHTQLAERGTAFGLYYLLSGVMALPGALVIGIVWQWFSAAIALLVSAALTAVCAIAVLRGTATRRVDEVAHE